MRTKEQSVTDTFDTQLYVYRCIKHCALYMNAFSFRKCLFPSSQIYLAFENDTHLIIIQIICFWIQQFHMHACTFHDAVMQLLSICINGLKDAYKTVLKKRNVDNIDHIWCIYGGICIQMHVFMHDACIGVCIFLHL